VPDVSKRIVLCFDGTADQIGAGNLTNVAKLFEMLEKNDPASQLAYYDPGVGTLAPAQSSLIGKLTLLFEQAFGAGLKENVAQAYRYVMQHWRPGDAIYIFGFSRGAYTARALAGMLLRPGLMRPGSENLLPYAVEKYAINRYFTQDEYDNWAQFARAFCWRTENEPLFETVKQNSPNQVWHYAVPVAYLGLWDTVKAAGFLRFGTLRWPYTRALPNVARIRHAVSIDERRRPYREYLVERHPLGLEERWFAGVHADVGGTFPDHRLATIALKWAADGIVGELAIDAEGKFLALRTRNISNMGAYLSTFAPYIPTYAGTSVLSSVYNFKAIYANILGVFTNTVPVDAYRGAGRPEANYLVERLVDAAAREQHHQQQQRPENDLPIFGDAGEHLFQQQEHDRADHRPE